MELTQVLKTNYKFPKKAVDKINQENQEKVKTKLRELKLNTPSSGQLYQALLNKAEQSERELLLYLGRVDIGTESGMQVLIDAALRSFPPKMGFFLKEEKAKELLIQNPPGRLQQVLGYKDVDALLSRENIYEIYGSLRFVETNEWMHKLIDSYKSLEKQDFEPRAFRCMVLSKRKWHDLARNFVKKKYHNLTHLKELGIIFALPRETGGPGTILSSFALLLHYFNEVTTNAEIFKLIDKKGFGEKLIPLLKGEIKTDGWNIIPRYLDKEEKINPIYFEPHINPEAIFWKKADQALMCLAKEVPGMDLDFWDDLDWVGDYFNGQLITFNSVDIFLSYANKLEINNRYLYHYYQALWNKLYSIINNNSAEYYFLKKWSK